MSRPSNGRWKDIHDILLDRVELLAQHGLERPSRSLIVCILYETVLMLQADRKQQSADLYTAGGDSSFTICIDHMLPGVLDGLLQHKNNDLLSLDALLKMVLPLESALNSYLSQAAAAKRTPAQIVMLEAAVQGWPKMAPCPTSLANMILLALTARLEKGVKPAPAGSPVPAASTTSSSTKSADGAALCGCHNLAVAQLQSQQGNRKATDVAADVAADMGNGASSKTPPTQEGASTAAGPSQPEQAEEAAAKPQNGLSEAEKAERRKAKKARQRADRAQAAAQTAEAEGTASKEPGPAERVGSAAPEQTHSAEAAETALEALHLSGSMTNAPEVLPPPTTAARSYSVASRSPSSPLSPQPSLPLQTGVSQGEPKQDVPSRAAPAAQAPSTEGNSTPTGPVHSSEETGSSRSSSPSPQPSMQLHSGMSHGLQAPDLPSWAAPAVQAPATPLQEEEPWQEVKKSRRKPTQQPASKASTHQSPTQGRVANYQHTPDSSPVQAVQAAALHRDQPFLTPERAGVPAHAQPVHAAASAVVSAESKPQQPSYDQNSASPQPSRSQAFPFSMQHELLQKTAGSSPAKEPCRAPQQMSSPGLCSGTSSHIQGAWNADLPEEEDPDDESLCVVCWEQLREVIFYQCMHMCTCKGCAKDIMAAGGLCPMCRAKIQNTITARF